MTPTHPTRSPLVFLKLGGALLTLKDDRERLRPDALPLVLDAVAEHWRASPGRLLLAHGSGSFGHVAARESGLVDRPEDPLAFARVAAAARRLSAIVVDELLSRGVPAVGVPGGLVAGVDEAGEAVDLQPHLIAGLLARGLLPVTHGDAAARRPGGGAILSTEPLLAALARELLPRRLVLATDVDGVYDVDPARLPEARPLPILGPREAERLASVGGLGGSRPGAVDLTGGMAGKVRQMLRLAADVPGLEIRIVSGLRPGALGAALRGEAGAGGTVIEGTN